MADVPLRHVTDIKQSRETEPDGQGGYHDVYKVAFTTPSGTRTHIKVPHTHYTAPNVAQLMAHELQHVEGVHALEGRQLPAVTPAASMPTRTD